MRANLSNYEYVRQRNREALYSPFGPFISDIVVKMSLSRTVILELLTEILATFGYPGGLRRAAIWPISNAKPHPFIRLKI